MASLAKPGACVTFQTSIGIEQEIAERKLIFVPLYDRRLPADRLARISHSRRCKFDGCDWPAF
jgi:hypothetical protein